MKRLLLATALSVLTWPIWAAPSTVTDLAATPNRCRQFDLTWTDAVPEPGHFITQVNLFKDTPNPTYADRIQDFGTHPCNPTTHACSGSHWSLNIAPGSTHSFRIQSQDERGPNFASAISAPVVVVAGSPCADLTAPGAPGTPTTSQPFGHPDTLCAQTFLNWTAATDTGGAGIHHYDLYENDALYWTNTVPALQFNGGAYRVPGLTYVYKVRAVDKDGNIGPFSGSTSITVDCTASAKLGSRKLLIVPLKFADRAAEPMTTGQLSTVGALIASWFNEVSYGKFQFQVTTLGWNYVLPKKVLFSDGGYCTSQNSNGYGLGCNISAIESDASATVGTDDDAYEYKIFYYNALGQAGFSGNPITVGTDFFDLQTGTHELGHTVAGLLHAGAYNCGGEVDGIAKDLLHLNPLVDTAAGQCTNGVSMSLYGDITDSMGGYPFTYSSLHRELFGWLDSTNRQVVLKSGDYTLEAVNVPGTGIKELRIPLPIHGYYYFLNFRRNTGFDAQINSGLDLQEGVYVYMHLNGQQGPDDDQFLLTPNLVGGYPIIGSGQFDDVYRDIHIQHIATNGNIATVRITMPDMRPGPRAKAHASGKVDVH